MSNLSGEQWEKKIFDEGVSSLEVWAIIADLKRLEAELAALKEQTRWIPVSERLPKDNAHVLFLSTGGLVLIGYHTSRVPQWTSIVNYSANNYANVTHWRPLPEPPEVE